jgi:protease I
MNHVTYRETPRMVHVINQDYDDNNDRVQCSIQLNIRYETGYRRYSRRHIMAHELSGKRVAILVDNGFEEVELTQPKQALEQAGAQTHIVSPQRNQVKSWQHTDWGQMFPVDVSVDQASADNYDALLLPGGVMNPDHLRRNEKVLQFVRAFFNAGKPVAAICHAPWTLIDAGVVSGRTMTSYPSLQMDLKNAGANWSPLCKWISRMQEQTGWIVRSWSIKGWSQAVNLMTFPPSIVSSSKKLLKVFTFASSL